jgi:hypothetical protein
MLKRDGAVGKISLAAQSEPGADSSAGAEVPGQMPLSRTARCDQLAYVSDMIGELATMAQRLGCPTLAGILDLAQREAHLERTRA